MIATSNFVNVTGAIAASLLFFVVVFAAQRTGLAPAVTDRQAVGDRDADGGWTCTAAGRCTSR